MASRPFNSCEDKEVDKEIFAPLRRAPWRFFMSRWPWLSVAYLAVTVALGAVTFGFLILFPLLPAWMLLLGEIEVRRAAFMVPGTSVIHREPIRWKELWDSLRRVVGWRHVVLCVMVAALAIAVFFFALVMVVLVGCIYRIMVGEGVFLSESRPILTGADPLGYRIGGILGLIGLVILTTYLLTAIALLEVFVTRAVLGADALERQVAQFSERNTALISAFEAERQRIERELHDGPQQHLANAAIQLGLARTQLEGQTSAADSRLELAQSEIEEAAEALRAAVRGLRPRTLIEDGLGADIHEMTAHAPIPVKLAYSLEERLDPAMEASLHFVVAEFLSNAYRHAHATHIDIRVWQDERTLHVVMGDDGVGGADPRLGTGIVGMMNRAHLMGGMLTVSSPVGGPTEMRLICPVAPEAAGSPERMRAHANRGR